MHYDEVPNWNDYDHNGIVDFSISAMMVENSYTIINLHKSRTCRIIIIIMEIYTALNMIMETQEQIKIFLYVVLIPALPVLSICYLCHTPELILLSQVIVLWWQYSD